MRNLIIFLSAVLCVGIGGGQQSGNKDVVLPVQTLPQCYGPCIFKIAGTTEPYVTLPSDDSGFGKASVQVYSRTGRIDRLSDAEYNQRQKLIQALADFDVKTAKAHGVDTEACPPQTITLTVDTCSLPDRYSYRGQFLLINVPEEAR